MTTLVLYYVRRVTTNLNELRGRFLMIFGGVRRNSSESMQRYRDNLAELSAR